MDYGQTSLKHFKKYLYIKNRNLFGNSFFVFSRKNAIKKKVVNQVSVFPLVVVLYPFNSFCSHPNILNGCLCRHIERDYETQKHKFILQCYCLWMVLTVYFGSKAQLILNFFSLICFLPSVMPSVIKDLQGYQLRSSTEVSGIFVMLWLQLIWPHLAWHDWWQNLLMGFLHFYWYKKRIEITFSN